MALGELKCRLGKGNLETHLCVQSQVPEGRSWEGKGEDGSAGGRVAAAQPLPRGVGPLAARPQPALGSRQLWARLC